MLEVRSSNPLVAWRILFLRRRDYDGPPGIPLYAYRVTADEFNELERLLKERLGVYLTLYSLGDVAKLMPYFAPLFVLYAAEWWRRKYDGSGWSWEPIVEGLGAPADGWTQAQRSECVERGLGEWRLELRNTRGLRFLGSVAFNGGLPMQLLATARGNIGHVLSRVLRLAGTGSVDAVDIQSWIASLSTYLPIAYRQAEIYVLLTEVILTVLKLRDSARLTTAAGAVGELDRHDPRWRNQFPFPIEDQQAQGLLEQLIRDAAVVRPARATARVVIERRLEQIEDGTWQLRTDADIPEYISATDLSSLFAADITTLPRLMNLQVTRAGSAVEMQVRRLAGQDRYRIDRRPLDSRQEEAASGHSLVLSAADGATWHAAVPKGEALDDGIPWIFEARAGDARNLRLVRQGSGAVSARDCWVCVPKTWRTQGDDGGECLQVGSLETMERVVVHMRGAARLEDETGQNFRIWTGQAAIVEEHLEWRGERIWEAFVAPLLAFRGVPKLYRVSEEGLTQPATGQIAWRILGARATPVPTGLYGPVEATWPASGDIRWRSRQVLLPSDSSEVLEAGNTPAEGRIRLVNWGASIVRPRTESVACICTNDGRTSVAELQWRGGGSLPEWVELEVLWQGNPQPSVIHLPFPAFGGKAFDAKGQQLPSGALLSVDQLPGVRLVAFLATTHRAQIELKPGNRTGNQGRWVIVREIKASAGSSRVEARLIDYGPEIQRLLANSDALDATVIVTLRPAGGPGVSLRVSRYAAGTQRDDASRVVMLETAATSRLSTDELDRVQLRAVRLDQPGDEPLALTQTRSQGVPTGCWPLVPERLAPGPWLVYPTPESALKCRPLLWPVGVVGASSDGLAHALRIADQSQRYSAIDSVIERLSSEFSHSDWIFVEHLAGHLGHLPLSSLDIWRRFSRSYAGVAALAFRLGSLPPGLVGRFATELPFLWEFVPFAAWHTAIALARRQCIDWYGNAGGLTMFDGHVGRRIQELSSSDHSLRVLLESARDFVIGTISQDVQVARQPMMEEVFAAQLFQGEQCRLQQLLRNNADSQWPEGFAADINAARRSAVTARYLCPVEHGFHDSVINAPILLAMQAVSAKGADWIGSADAIAALRTHQAFDPDWFAEAFDLTVARCLATGLLRIEI